MPRTPKGSGTSGSGTSKSRAAAAPPARKSALRALWTGHLKLSLVTVPVIIVSATASDQRLAFHQVHVPSGKRIKYDKVVPGVGPGHLGLVFCRERRPLRRRGRVQTNLHRLDARCQVREPDVIPIL